jgi:DNA polymerase V
VAAKEKKTTRRHNPSPEETHFEFFDVLQPFPGDRMNLKFFAETVPAGFPSPAEGTEGEKIDLNDLITHPISTFVLRAKGDSMINTGIRDGDLLIVDRSLNPSDNKVVIGVINGEFTVKRLRKRGNKIQLVPENPDFNPIEITPEMDFRVWGVVTYVIHKL